MHKITIGYLGNEFTVVLVVIDETLQISCNMGTSIKIDFLDIIADNSEYKKLVRKLLKECEYNMQIFTVLIYLFKEIINSYKHTVKVDNNINLRFTTTELTIIGNTVECIKIPKGREILNWNLKDVFKNIVVDVNVVEGVVDDVDDAE